MLLCLACFSTDDQRLEKPRAESLLVVGEAGEGRVRVQAQDAGRDEIYDDVVEYGKALGILPNF
jgi:hypothetical protein